MTNTSPHRQTEDYEIIELGHPLLQQVANPVRNFQDPVLAQHLQAVMALMNERQGVGIAAPQLGISLQIMVVASRPNARYPGAPLMEPVTLINPEIEWQSDHYVKDWEGCLSVPGIRGLIQRPDAVRVRYADPEGQQRKVEWSGFLARIFLHEYDHLIGKTFIDRAASSTDLFSEKEYLRRVQAMRSQPAGEAE